MSRDFSSSSSSSASSSLARGALGLLLAAVSAGLGLASCDGGSSAAEGGSGECPGCCFGDGCGDPPPSPPAATCIDGAAPDPAAAAIVAGTMVDGAFTEITDNQQLPIEYGAQGGQHVWVTLRIFTNGTGTFEYKAQLDQEGGGVQAAFDGCGTAQWAELIDVPVFLNSGQPGPRTLVVTVAPAGQATAAMLEIPVEVQ
jgi:hypothetical protein